MALHNNLYVQDGLDKYTTLGDRRWLRTAHGNTDGVNANLVIDDTLKAEGTHREGNWIKSGLPVTFDKDTKTVKMWQKGAGDIYGFLYTDYRVVDFAGEFYETIPVAVLVHGMIYAQWLPVEVTDEDLKNTPLIQNTIL